MILRLAGAPLGVVIALMAVGAAEAAPASKPRVAVVRTEFAERVPEMSRVFLSQRLVEGLAAAGFEVIAGAMLERALQGGPKADTCRAPGCYREIGVRLGVDYLVTAKVGMERKNYELTLELIGREKGTVHGGESARCELCGIQEVGAKLDQLASSLRSYVQAARPGATRLSLESDPPGVGVTIDGREAGPTPVALELAPGAHEVLLARPGRDPLRHQIDLAPGADKTVRFELAHGNGSANAVSGFWRKVGWGSLAVGAAALLVGTLVLSQDGEQTSCGAAAAPGQQCQRNTRLAAGALFGGGAVAGLGGALLLSFGGLF